MAAAAAEQGPEAGPEKALLHPPPSELDAPEMAEVPEESFPPP